jgi:hypothetical protein
VGDRRGGADAPPDDEAERIDGQPFDAAAEHDAADSHVELKCTAGSPL